MTSTVLPVDALQAPWRREFAASLSATAAMVPMVVMFAFLSFSSVGPQAAQLGLTASVVGLVFGGAVMALLGRSPLPIGSPTAPTSLILGGLVAQLAGDPQFQPDAPGAAAVLIAVTGATVILSGVFLVAMGALRLGDLARFAPQPVLAGFMNGIAILIFVAQIAPVLGLPADTFERDGVVAALRQTHWLSTGVALGTTALVFMIGWRFPRAPAALIGLLIALAAVEIANALRAEPVPLARLGELSIGMPSPAVLLPLFSESAAPVLRYYGATLVTTALVLALIGALQSVLSIASMDQQTNTRTDLSRELRALGLANVVSGVFGGLPLAYLRLFAWGCFSAGGRSYRSVLATLFLLLLVFTLGLPLVARLPQAVVAGILLVVSWTLVDHWTRDLVVQWWKGDRPRELAASLFIVAVVCAVTLKWGFAAGVAAGSLVAAVIFMRALNRSLVRRRYFAADIPSRRVYPPELESILAGARGRIEVIELEGALFFGNADRLADAAETTPPGVDFLVVDFRRVTTVDASGAFGLSLLDQRLRRRGTTLLFAGVTRDNRHGRAILAQGVFRSPADWRGYPDADRAVEAAEMHLLEAAGHPLAHLAMPLEHCAIFEGLSALQREVLWPRLIRREIAPGAAVFEEGDPGNAIYVLTEGSITIVDRSRTQRFLAFAAGMCFGEAAVLDGRGRSAAAIADAGSVLYELPAQALRELQSSDPALAAQLYLNLARHLSERLRSAGTAWRQAAG